VVYLSVPQGQNTKIKPSELVRQTASPQRDARFAGWMIRRFRSGERAEGDSSARAPLPRPLPLPAANAGRQHRPRTRAFAQAPSSHASLLRDCVWSNVSTWPEGEVRTGLPDVGFRVNTGRDVLTLSSSPSDPERTMVGDGFRSNRRSRSYRRRDRGDQNGDGRRAPRPCSGRPASRLHSSQTPPRSMLEETCDARFSQAGRDGLALARLVFLDDVRPADALRATW
jgi:hypothetical protein